MVLQLVLLVTIGVSIAVSIDGIGIGGERVAGTGVTCVGGHAKEGIKQE